MSDRRHRRFSRFAKLALLALILPGLALRAQTAPAPAGAKESLVSAADRELLAASDLFGASPEEFRVEIEVRSGAATTQGMPLEIFRRGPDLALVRLLGEKDRGKFLLRRDRDLYFISPGSARPVKLAPSYRLQGAALDELLGLRLVRDFRIESLHDAGGVATFDLVANDPHAASPRLRWAVDRAKRTPLRADLQTESGKVLRVIEFKEWNDAKRGIPLRMVVKEVARGGAPMEIRFANFKAQPVALELFDLTDGKARAALAPPTGATGAH
ncbi:MAG: outer membrane lipoprotein-sorting protein [Thermoanaerobaculia bacterium]